MPDPAAPVVSADAHRIVAFVAPEEGVVLAAQEAQLWWRHRAWGPPRSIGAVLGAKQEIDHQAWPRASVRSRRCILPTRFTQIEWHSDLDVLHKPPEDGGLLELWATSRTCSHFAGLEMLTGFEGCAVYPGMIVT